MVSKARASLGHAMPKYQHIDFSRFSILAANRGGKFGWQILHAQAVSAG
jgi:hypothetical protein